MLVTTKLRGISSAGKMERWKGVAVGRRGGEEIQEG